MKPRRLTVARTTPESRGRHPRPPLAPMPLLRLKGRWMDAAGFAIGRPVRVEVTPGRLVLEIVDDETR